MDDDELEVIAGVVAWLMVLGILLVIVIVPTP